MDPCDSVIVTKFLIQLRAAVSFVLGQPGFNLPGLMTAENSVTRVDGAHSDMAVVFFTSRLRDSFL